MVSLNIKTKETMISVANREKPLAGLDTYF